MLCLGPRRGYLLIALNTFDIVLKLFQIAYLVLRISSSYYINDFLYLFLIKESLFYPIGVIALCIRVLNPVGVTFPGAHYLRSGADPIQGPNQNRLDLIVYIVLKVL